MQKGRLVAHWLGVADLIDGSLVRFSELPSFPDFSLARNTLLLDVPETWSTPLPYLRWLRPVTSAGASETLTLPLTTASTYSYSCLLIPVGD